MSSPLLLCTDLDRTLIPNGAEPESPAARPWFRRLAALPEVTLAYVSGRHRALVEAAIADYDLPMPDYVVGDVGTSIHGLDGGDWQPIVEWQRLIGADWGGTHAAALRPLFADIAELSPQPDDRQGPFKLSYFTPAQLDVEALRARMRERLEARDIRASLVWSVDEAAGCGLLDLLPANATKYHAVEFLMQRLGRDVATTVFAGDSGNDLEVLISAIPAVLVANAHPEVRAEARQGCADPARLYCARGGWQGLNGHYAAGILEGVAHFHPELAERLLAAPETPAGPPAL
ncbi:HAD-IIB family hydrolase [Marichromatium sp. AB32]|uniref:HAD-IIB family hydrolase n=1 Tax=Marichromatium sp. AB32 TaxID=2483363 RepID=UPI000F407FA9|nr:HAD-IIB family hydrolase [Marichromatium sp. AB32]MBO8085349.1 HAD-IIB family hydrolase [Marichromatium sp.]RNE93279.1 HAD-IIB family hydrolase [Marichromatium sp. AB32]